MRPALVALFLITGSLLYSQSYVDSGIRHFNVGEYDEALKDFESAIEISQMLTETAKAKIYYYRGLIWIKKLEKPGNKQNHIDLALSDLSKVASMDANLQPQVNQVYEELSPILMEEADALMKSEKKAKELPEKLEILDQRISYLKIVKELGINSLADLYLGETNKMAGDLIFENSSNVSEMQRAGEYYREAIKYLELARYNDPFDKNIIKTILDLARKLDDAERVKEYLKLLELAGG